MKPSELIHTYGHCTHAWARDEDGAHVHPTSRRAVSFCLVGALIAIYGDSKSSLLNLSMGPVVSPLGKVMQKLNIRSIHGVVIWNDEHTKGDTLTLLESIGE